MKTMLDKSELELEAALKNNEYVSASESEETTEMFLEAAKTYIKLQQSKSVTLRVNFEDLVKIKAKAKRNGIAYQTLIGLLIRQYVKGETEIVID